MTFTPADHVTQREDGPWRDCTWASMLETLRLGLPDGAAIPSTQAEVERFRAAGGYPDNHPGVTIEQTLPAARSRYGLTTADYTLIRDWPQLAVALEDPSKVAVVTGIVPAGERITPFAGPHAVAKHGVRVRCDPLGPKDGTYQGNVWPLTTWRQFATSLPNWQAFVMDARGGAVQITDPTPMRVDLPSGRQLYQVDGTTPLVKVVPATVDTYSPAGGPKALQRYVVITTGGVRQLAVVRTSGLVFTPYCPTVAPGDVQHSVTVQIDGAETYRTTV